MNKGFNLFPTPAPPAKIHLPGRRACVRVIPGPCPQARGRGSIHPAGVSAPPSRRPAGMGTLGSAEKALSHVQGTLPPESRAFGVWGCGSAGSCRVRGRGGGAAGARGARGFPLCQAPGRWRPRLLGVSGPKCGGCQRLTSPLPAGSGSRGRGHPQKGSERPPAPGLCPSSCTFSPPCPLEFSSFICSPRSSPFQRPICRHTHTPPTPLLFCFYPSILLSSVFLLFLHPLDILGGSRGRGGKVPVGIGRPLVSHLAQPGLGPGGGRNTRPTTLIQASLLGGHSTYSCENNVKAHLKKNKQLIFSFFSYLLFTRYGWYKYNNGFTFHNGFSSSQIDSFA